MISAVVTDITWERVLLHFWVKIKNDSSLPLDFYLVDQRGKADAKFEVKYTDSEHCCLTINVTNNGLCRSIKNGIYLIYAYTQGQTPVKVKVNERTAAVIQTKNRYMLHGIKGRGMCLYFSLADTIDCLYPQLQVIHAIQEIPDYEPLSKKIEDFCTKIKKIGINLFYPMAYLICHKLPHKPQILFMSEKNEKPNANFIAVEQRIKDRSLEKKYTIKHSFRAATVHKHSIFNWISLVVKIADSDVIFVDDYCPLFDWLILKKQTKLIQLWHAGAGYKTVGYSRWGYRDSPQDFSCHRQYTYGIAPSKNTAYFFWEQFGINPEQVLPTGMPRMDKYLDPEFHKQKTKELYELYPQIQGKRVILFAPTYRGHDKRDAYYPYDKINFEKLFEFCGTTYITIFKMHPWVKHSVPIKEEWKNRFIDANKYPNINDLFYITDIFISDYSSGVFEYSVMHKPALFYAFDEVEYSYSRGFHRAYAESTPGKICHTFDELLNALKNNDFEFEKMEAYTAHHFDNLDGGACDKVIDWCLLDKLPQEYRDAQQKRTEENRKIQELQFL